ncbi:hypothetical protein TNCV_1980201 [Trichonephila clavipes]|nr:hypothetical protein TNCV_1980201 [Trichonephila clavipes]
MAGVVVLGDGGHVLVLRSCATKECGWAGVVALGDGGHVLVLRSCATKKCEWYEEGPELSLLVMEVMCWFSGPAPQKNVGGMMEATLELSFLVGGHVLFSCHEPQKMWVV